MMQLSCNTLTFAVPQVTLGTNVRFKGLGFNLDFDIMNEMYHYENYLAKKCLMIGERLTSNYRCIIGTATIGKYCLIPSFYNVFLHVCFNDI